MESLRELDAPEDVLRNLEMISKGVQSHKAEIDDLETLMSLDNMSLPGEHEVKKMKKMEKGRNPDHFLVCARCNSLKSQSKLIETKLPVFEAGRPLNLSEHVLSFNRANIVQTVFKQIYSRSIIIYVIDITNFEGSQIEEIYDLINKGKHRVLIVVNKIDAIPHSFKVQQLQQWVKK